MSTNAGSTIPTAPIAIVGVNHRSAPIALRERFALNDESEGNALRSILQLSTVDEAVVLSTCNRTEIITASSGGHDVGAGVDQILGSISGVGVDELRRALYKLDGKNAVAHLFRVASGLDSLVMGEPQILGQLKRAYERARQSGSTQTILNKLFHRAFGIAKAVRTRTAIGERAVSVGLVAKKLADEIFADLNDATVLLIGAGEMGALVLRYFASSGVRRIYVVNRSVDRAVELAEHFRALPASLDSLESLLPEADIIIGCAQAERGTSIISAEASEVARSRRDGRNQFYIDLGVPRNFDPEIGSVSECFLYTIDDLETVVSQNLDARTIEAAQAELIIAEGVDRFLGWWRERPAEEQIAQLLRDVESWKESEIQKTLRRLKGEGIDSAALEKIEPAIRKCSDAFAAKILSRPIRSVKGRSSETPAYLETFTELFLQSESEDDETKS